MNGIITKLAGPSILVIALAVFASDAYAVYLSATATGGDQLAFVAQDSADGFMGDFTAEATHDSTVLEDDDQGYARASLGAGVELASKSYAPDKYARSKAAITDFFTPETVTGQQQDLVDAAANFVLTGSIHVSRFADSMGSITLTMYGGPQSGFLYANPLVVSYIVTWDSGLGQAVGMNDTSWGAPLMPVNPTISGQTYTFNIPISWQLLGLKADESNRIRIELYSEARQATVDFSNTLMTDPDTPFVITSAPTGSSYRLITGSNYDDYGVGLFADLDGEIVVPVPEPAALPLLLSGILGASILRHGRS